jgi:hypothetical protein
MTCGTPWEFGQRHRAFIGAAAGERDNILGEKFGLGAEITVITRAQ